MKNIDVAWDRIKREAGSSFTTVTGLPFTYSVPGNYLLVNRTIRNLSRTNFAKALDQLPCDGPAGLVGRQGASYTYAILMDPRIRRRDW